jgi:hypothetical protein
LISIVKVGFLFTVTIFWSGFILSQSSHSIVLFFKVFSQVDYLWFTI